MNINFSLNNEQNELKKIAYNFSKTIIKPQASLYDKTCEWPQTILDKAWQLGLLNIHIPSQYKGIGLSLLDGTLIEEELAWGCSGLSTVIMANSLGQMPVILSGTEEQKEKWLKPFNSSNIVCSYAVTEPTAGSDVANIKTFAYKKNNKYILNGEKIWITNIGKAKWVVVLAITDKTQGYKGLSMFIVPCNLEGITIGKKEDNMGQRVSDTRSIIFKDVEIPLENRLGREGDGFFIVMKTFDYTRPMVAASAVGVARAAMEYALEYSMQRKTFNKFLYEHQHIASILVDMSTNIEAARLLTWKAAQLLDAKKNNTIFASFAKYFSAEQVMKITTDAVQIFGGYGYNKEFPVEKLMRDAKIFQIYEGTSQIQKIIIMRELIKNSTI